MTKSFCYSLIIFFVTISSHAIYSIPMSELWPSWSPIQVWQNYKKKHAQKHVGEKPAWFKFMPYNNGSYVQFNFDARDFCLAMIVKMTAQTMYAMAHTGTRIENFKTAVWRPGIARSMINWVPFAVTCSMLASMKERKELAKKLEEVEHAHEHSVEAKESESKKSE